MDVSDFYHMAGKGINDPEFNRRLIENPEKALGEIGIEPTREVIEALKGLDYESLQRVAKAFGPVPLYC